MNAHAAIVLSADALVVQTDGVTLLAAIGVQLHAGEVLGIVGPNGAGKSTLLRVLAGVQPANSGEVHVNGKALNTIPANERGRYLAWLEQSPHVHWPLTVAQVVSLGRLPHGDMDSAVAQTAVDSALRATDTAMLQARDFHTLSEGEKMRVHLARVLAGAPRIVLADEPTAALDPWHQLQVLELLRAEAARGTGVMLVLHDLGLAARFCDRLLLLDGGRAVACGSPRDVLTTAALASIWRIDARFNSDTLSLVIVGRKS